MGIFLDTGFFLSISHPDDVNNVRGVEILDDLYTGKYGLLYTSELIIGEAISLAWIRTKGNINLVHDLETLILGDDQLAKILYMDEKSVQMTCTEFNKFNRTVKTKHEFLSFTDVSSIVLCRTYGIEQIISFDPHFDAFLTRIY
ncbi:MAG TPA: PIN domain-containing protein [Candidatus Lokiarchaeia archaeon]|nr:PIN domain-containing protein [Candidatus Lokiarchaeia archaeon]